MQCVINKNARGNSVAAFSRLELLVVICVVLVVVGLIFLPTSPMPRQKAPRIACLNNLMQLSTAIRVWENDNVETLPVSNCWSYYSLIMSDLGENPRMLRCPADERRPATNDEVLKDNSHLSYFVVVAPTNEPQWVSGGDRNLAPGTTPDPEYGFSPTNDVGNDVIITGPVCWSLKMHSRGNITGAGNVMLADGSCQECTSVGLQRFLPSTNAFHVLFP